jgi:hypothetical protein
MTDLAPKMGYFFGGKSDELFLDKKVLGYTLGEFFRNSSGHPGLSRSAVGHCKTIQTEKSKVLFWCPNSRQMERICQASKKGLSRKKN